MAMKPDLPSIDDELVQPRPRPSFTNLRPRDDLTDSAIEANSRSIGQQRGASTRLPQPEEETPLASIRTDIPEYVDKQLKLKIVEEGGTKAYYILKGLSAIGFKVDGRTSDSIAASVGKIESTFVQMSRKLMPIRWLQAQEEPWAF